MLSAAWLVYALVTGTLVGVTCAAAASVQVTKTSGASEVRISTQGTNTLTMPARQRDPFAGLYFIDGVRADAAAVNALDPGAIASVEVIKGPAAVLVSSDAAATNGIIRVTTKPALRAR